MERTMNIPIQMISSCSTQGDFTPIRFRFKDSDEQLITVNVDAVLSHSQSLLNGSTEIVYTCQATIANINTLFLLKYNVNSHKWSMYKLLT